LSCLPVLLPGRAPEDWTEAERRDAALWAQKEGKLAPSRIQRLEAIGFSWDPLSDELDKTAERFAQYFKINGRIPPPKYRDEDDYPLGQRCVTLRSSYKINTLRLEWIPYLEEIEGWTWDPGGDAVVAIIQAIKNHVEQKGCLPTSGDLGAAVKARDLVETPARLGQKGGLRPEHVALLEKVPGWTWDPFGDRFEQNIQETKEFVQQDGRLPRQKESKLGRWLGHLREKKDKLGIERSSRLDQEFPGWAA
jgi:hypothetical protein